MKEITVTMALVDYIPIFLYLLAAVILQRDLYPHMRKGAYAVFAAGTIDVFCAGLAKATYKLLYALGICDFEALNAMFFPVQSLGFLLAGLGVVGSLRTKKKKTAALAVAAPAVWSGTFFFVALMIIGLGMMDAGLCVIAKRRKKSGAVVLLIISFVCCLSMGYLSSRDFERAFFNWIAEGINVIGQLALLLAVLILHFSGLGKDTEQVLPEPSEEPETAE